jgi:homoserine O-acetyltransferase
MLYQFNASRDYDPLPNLEKIAATVLAIKYVLIPTSDQTRGHGRHSLPAVWGQYLADFMKELTP